MVTEQNNLFFLAGGAKLIKPMLAYEVEVNNFLSKNGLDGEKVTAAYREAIMNRLVTLMAQGFRAEVKWDGTRVIAYTSEPFIMVLQNRHGVNYTIRLSDIAKGLQQLHGIWTLDSEAVYINPETGREEFTPCQVRCSTQYPAPFLKQKYPLTLEIFDVLEHNGINLERRPYTERKLLLQKMLEGTDYPLKYVPYEADLLKEWKRVIESDLEGLIVKKWDSAYEHDRSYSWLKVKNWRFETCDVIGYTAGENARAFFFGALILEKDGHYRGKAGSGFNDWELRKWKDLFHAAPKMQQPYSEQQVGESYTAIKTDAKVLVKYYQVTENKVLRFPIFVASNI